MNRPQHPPINWQEIIPRLTDARRARLEGAASRRTRHLRLVIQDIHHPHNVSACLRSAEAFGVQTVHVVTMREKFNPSTVAKGVAPWLTIHRHPDIASCVAELRRAGYRLAAGYPDQGALSLEEIALDAPIAVVFGNEHAGISDEWKPHIDVPFTIPMAGLVESLNISVSAAISLYTLTRRARQQLGDAGYFLTPAEQRTLLDGWAQFQV